MVLIPLPGTQIEMTYIPPGEFVMGSSNELFSESPAHRVMIANAFHVGRYPITQAQWHSVTSSNPSVFLDACEQPVDNVSWDQATAYCELLSQRCGLCVRLPSEAEWEYACRAGTTGEFFFTKACHFVDESAIPSALSRALTDYAWFDLNSGGTTHPVGLKRPNAWDLYDMVGNVWEWCSDVWHVDYTRAQADGSSRTDGAAEQPRRCLRGGAWNMDAFRCRSTYRSCDWKQLATSTFGLRIVVDGL